MRALHVYEGNNGGGRKRAPVSCSVVIFYGDDNFGSTTCSTAVRSITYARKTVRTNIVRKRVDKIDLVQFPCTLRSSRKFRKMERQGKFPKRVRWKEREKKLLRDEKSCGRFKRPRIWRQINSLLPRHKFPRPASAERNEDDSNPLVPIKPIQTEASEESEIRIVQPNSHCTCMHSLYSEYTNRG